MFESTFKNVDDILRKDAGCGSELDYVEQSSWVLFLKYLDDLEVEREIKAKLAGKPHKSLFDSEFQWRNWAVPKTSIGKIDYDKAKTGDDLTQFINSKLFPYLASFKHSAVSPATLEYKVGEIFSEVKNRIQSGYNLREVLDLVDELKFQTAEELHEMSFLYENKIKNMGNAGRNGGEYYTPRPLIKAIIEVIGPKVGDTIYDGAVGSAGFLCEAFTYLIQSKKLSSADIETLQTKTFYGKEKKSLPYVIGIMNMILHGIDAPNLIHTNTLAENLADVQEKDRYDIVLANPPFGGKERREIQQNFPIKTGETAYLFLQHFMKTLKAGGRAGIVIKNSFLTNTESAAISIRKELLANFSIDGILDLPSGTFQGTPSRTIVLFLTKGSIASKIWLYQLEPEKNFGKLNPLKDSDLADFLAYFNSKKESTSSWTIDVTELDNATAAIPVQNPNKPKLQSTSPEAMLANAQSLEAEVVESLSKTSALFVKMLDSGSLFSSYPLVPLRDLIKIERKQAKDLSLPYLGMEDIVSGEIYLDETPEPKSVKSGTYYFSTEHVLYGRLRPYLNKVVVPDFEGRCSTEVFPLLAGPRISREYLAWMLSSRYMCERITQTSTGTRMPRANMNEVLSFGIPLPTLEEQDVIIGYLNSLHEEGLRQISIFQDRQMTTAKLKESILDTVFGAHG